MNSKKIKILFAAVDVGYRIENYTNFLNSRYSNESYSESLTIYSVPTSHYKTKYTFEYNFNGKSILYKRFRAFANFLRAVFKYNTIHFISGETLLPRKLRRFELATYKFFKKNIIMHFVGSDIRSESYLKWKTKNIFEFLNGGSDEKKTFEWQDKLIAQSIKYSNSIIVSTPDLKKLIPKADYYPVLLDYAKFKAELDLIPAAPKTANTITILHSPSSKTNNLKGSEYIYPILEKIKLSTKIKIELIFPADENKKSHTSYPATRYEMFELYKKADIIIDQMIIGWYGLLAIEGIAAGKQVISYVDEELKENLYPDSPILLANVNTLENCILKCIDNLILGNINTDQQIAWVNKYHTIENNNDILLNAWRIKTNKP